MNAPSSSTAPTLALAARAVASGQHYPAGSLYVVATPIGNLADFSLRAVHVLGLVDAVACEDTRVTGGLLRHLGLDKPLLPLHQHNEREATERVLARLAAGERVAYVSDAGTPAVSDPGAVLVGAARAAGWRVLPIPGASSVVTALSAAGHAAGAPSVGFHFAGFLPAKGQERQAALADALGQGCDCVLFEAPHRLAALFAQLAERAPARQVTVCRELTKQFEQIETLPGSDLPAWLAADPMRAKGEFVLVLHAEARPPAMGEDALDEGALRALSLLLRDLPLKQAVGLAADITGAPRNALYTRALALKGQGG